MYELKHVDKYFGKHGGNPIHVINDVTLSLPDKGLIAIYGISGCGKTTLLNVLGGIDRFNGSVTINGEELGYSSNDYLRNKYIGYIFQNYNLEPALTVLQNVMIALKLAGLEDKSERQERALKALASVGMEKYKNRFPSSLSGGQQQRVAIARAVAKSPAVILADEPTGNLDEANTHSVMELLKQLSTDKLVLLVTHEDDLVEHYCDHIITLHDGKVASFTENNPDGEYDSTDKRKIYLGDLSKSERSERDVDIELFTDNSIEIDGSVSRPSIRVIASKGRIYLQCADNRVRFIDSKSEIKTVDSTSEAAKAARKSEQADTSALPPLENTKRKTGRAFGFIDSIIDGYRITFKGRKLGKKVLIAVLMMFAVAFVFNVSSFGSEIYSLQNARLSYNENVIFVKVESSEEITKLKEVTDPRSEVHHHTYSNEIYTYYALDSGEITISGFESMRIDSKMFRTSSSTFSVVRDRKLIYGEFPDEGNGVVVTEGFASAVTKSGTFGFMNKTYQVTMLKYNGKKICGVVEGDDICVFYPDAYFDRQYVVDNVMAVKASDYGAEVAKGHVLINADPSTAVLPSETVVLIDGNSYTVDGFFQILDNSKNSFEADPEDNIGYYYAEYLISDEDFARLTETLYAKSCQMAVYSADVDKDIAAISAVFDNDAITVPEELDKAVVEEAGLTIALSAIELAIYVAIMFGALFLIMRSNMMARIKEIGIYRVIGASKKNIMFKFMCETLMITTLTVFVGYCFSSGILMKITSMTSYFNSFAYYPVWLAALSLLTLYLLSFISGILPALFLLRKTPAEILARYDI